MLKHRGDHGTRGNGRLYQAQDHGTQSVTGRAPWELLGLVLVAVVLYLAFSGIIMTLLSRKAPGTRGSFDLPSGRVLSRTKRVRHHRRDREGRVDRGQGADRALDTTAADPAPRPPAP